MKCKPKLFCFTYAGGTSAFFDVIGRDLEGFELIGPEYAGHGPRHAEPFYTSFEELADDVFKQIRDRITDGCYGLFGYSMGSITLVEVLKRIMNHRLPLPSHVFLAAHEPHTKAELTGYSPDELDEWVKERTIRFGAVPEKLLNNRVYWRTYLPVYRADYGIIGKYRFEELSLNSEIPATVFYSQTDTPLADMKLWEKYFTRSCEFIAYEGHHFFIQEHHAEMAGIILSRMGMTA